MSFLLHALDLVTSVDNSESEKPAYKFTHSALGLNLIMGDLFKARGRFIHTNSSSNKDVNVEILQGRLFEMITFDILPYTDAKPIFKSIMLLDSIKSDSRINEKVKREEYVENPTQTYVKKQNPHKLETPIALQSALVINDPTTKPECSSKRQNQRSESHPQLQQEQTSSSTPKLKLSYIETKIREKNKLRYEAEKKPTQPLNEHDVVFFSDYFYKPNSKYYIEPERRFHYKFSKLQRQLKEEEEKRKAEQRKLEKQIEFDNEAKRIEEEIRIKKESELAREDESINESVKQAKKYENGLVNLYKEQLLSIKRFKYVTDTQVITEDDEINIKSARNKIDKTILRIEKENDESVKAYIESLKKDELKKIEVQESTPIDTSKLNLDVPDVKRSNHILEIWYPCIDYTDEEIQERLRKIKIERAKLI